MIPLSAPVVDGNEGAYLAECVRSGFVSSVGPFVQRFERQLCEAVGGGYACATSSGTAALQMMLVGGGVRPGDLVIMPTLTFIATANAVMHAGATPWLMDVDQETWSLSPDVVARELDEAGEWRGSSLYHRLTGARISAIMSVHPMGFPGNVGRLREVADSYMLPLYVDGAAAVGATFEHRPIGCAPVRATALSFNGNKVITTGGGGAVVSFDEELVARVRHLSSTARSGPAYEHDDVGYNYRMTNLEAAVGCAQLERLENFVARRRAIYREYISQLCDVAGAVFAAPPEKAVGEGSCWLSILMSVGLNEDELQAIRQIMREDGIDMRPFWVPVHRQKPYRAVPQTKCPVADDLWWRLLALPSSANLDDDKQEFVIGSLRQAIARMRP